MKASEAVAAAERLNAFLTKEDQRQLLDPNRIAAELAGAAAFIDAVNSAPPEMHWFLSGALRGLAVRLDIATKAVTS